MTRYTRHAGEIQRLTKMPFSYQLTPCKRVPKPVREAFSGISVGGFTEVDFDPKTRAVRIVPFYERIQGA